MRKNSIIVIGFILIQIGLKDKSYSQDVSDSATAKTIVEFAEPKIKKSAGLSTVMYLPSEQESIFFQRLQREEKTTGGLFSNYDILGKKGKHIGWFGIVRGANKDSISGETTYIIEMKYFDGLSDEHIMLVGFSGAGDFKAIIKGNAQEIKLLSLVKVYGIVLEELNSIPIVTVDYVRVWDWGLFTFMSYGNQKGNSEWKKLNKVAENDIYDPHPNKKFYEDRLGKRE